MENTLQQITNNILNPVVIQTNISAFIKALIRKMINGQHLTESGKIYSKSTIRGYNSLLINFKNFELYHDANFDFREVGYQFAREFQNFLTAQGLSKNSIGLILAKFKAVITESFKLGISPINGNGLIKCTHEKTTQTYLSLPELKKLRQANLTKYEEKVLDFFLIGCFTGLRYDTLSKFLSNPLSFISDYEGESFIEITSDKTNIESVIPLGKTVINIITKNNGKLKCISEQYANRTIKQICKKAGLDNEVVMRRTESGKMEEKMVKKWETISTHTARRTLISLMRVKNFTNKEITIISGHSNEAQMLDYDRSGNFEKVKNLLGNTFFDTEI